MINKCKFSKPSHIHRSDSLFFYFSVKHLWKQSRKWVLLIASTFCVRNCSKFDHILCSARHAEEVLDEKKLRASEIFVKIRLVKKHKRMQSKSEALFTMFVTVIKWKTYFVQGIPEIMIRPTVIPRLFYTFTYNC